MSSTDPGLNNDAWHHVLVTYPGGGDASTITVYLNGKTLGMASGSTALNTSAAAFVVAGSNHNSDTERNFHGQIDDVGYWSNGLSAVDAALLNGLGRIGDNNLDALAAASTLWGGLVNDTATINGVLWKKVGGLTGALGDWSQIGGANGNGSFIVLDGASNGLQIIPEPASLLLSCLGLLGVLRRRR
jgi:hypothetical protein